MWKSTLQLTKQVNLSEMTLKKEFSLATFFNLQTLEMLRVQNFKTVKSRKKFPMNTENKFSAVHVCVG